MAVSQFLRRLFRGRNPRTVELEPIHQRILRALNRFGTLEFSRLAAEVTVEHPAPTGEVLLALLKLEHEGLVNRTQTAQQSRQTATYGLGQQGKRIAGILPASATSNIDLKI
jgi:DNA-binding HxlR family transcriptional regulator